MNPTQLTLTPLFHQLTFVCVLFAGGNSLMEQMLWSDPDDALGRSDSPRGCSLLFGPDVVEEFLGTNHLQLIVRSHECVKQGFEKMFNDKLITGACALASASLRAVK